MKKSSPKTKIAEPVLTTAAKAIGSTIGKLAAKAGLGQTAPLPKKEKPATAKPQKKLAKKKLARRTAVKKVRKSV